MLKKRLIGVITVKDNWAVQSIGYKTYLPLGKPKIIAENLDRWGVDEIICLSIDRSIKKQGPNYELIKSITSQNIATPLTYGGGIDNYQDAAKVIKCGVERLIIDNAFHKNMKEVIKISEKIGSQALIISLPVCINENSLKIYDYLKKELLNFNSDIDDFFINNHSSEIMLIDKKNEGVKDGFNKEILDHFHLKETKKIIFGGLDNIEKIKYLISQSEVEAIAVGNYLNFKEHSVQKIKEEIKLNYLRKSHYKKN